MGCSDCESKGACDHRKEAQRALLEGVIRRMYPQRTWGRSEDEARFGGGVPRPEAKWLARALSAVAQAPTFFRPGADEDLCDFIWVLCLGRAPALVDLRDGIAEVGEPLLPEGAQEETYLRVAISSVARLAAVQEVRLRLEADAEGALFVRETARAGVFDPQLLPRLRSVVTRLAASHVTHVDFALLDVPLEEGAPGDYADRYGVEPRLFNFLFSAAPATTGRVTLLTDRAAKARTRTAASREPA